MVMVPSSGGTMMKSDNQPQQPRQCEEENFLSEHTLAMREALQVCQLLLLGSDGQPKNFVWSHSQHWDSQAKQEATYVNLLRHRQQALRKNATLCHKVTLPSVTCIKSCPHSAPEDDVSFFRRHFQQANQPCRIQGMATSCFGADNLFNNKHWSNPRRSREWIRQINFAPCAPRACHSAFDDRKTNENNHSGNHNHGSSSGELLLPVRQEHTPPGKGITTMTTTADLDAEGRAQECTTVQMSLPDWIAYLDQLQEEQSERGNLFDNDANHDKLYLKDWHFQAWFQATQLEDQSCIHVPPVNFLYMVPRILGYDLLNSFLQAFFTAGDYRFVYWGPAGSQTGWHSDVLHSFSWSFLHYGIKHWTFQVPSTDGHNDNDGENNRNNNNSRNQKKTIEVVQTAGECIFVPATWKHRVVNLQETLSINHNWVTAANLDLCWDCLQTEIQAIERELSSWVGTDYDWNARECMLRGCAGLDVTAFYLMVLYRLALIQKETTTSNTPTTLGHGLTFEVVRCIETLRTLLRDGQVHLLDRLEATLASKERAKEAVELGHVVCKVL